MEQYEREQILIRARWSIFEHLVRRSRTMHKQLIRMSVVGALACTVAACSSGAPEPSSGRTGVATAALSSAKGSNMARVEVATAALAGARGLVAAAGPTLGVSARELEGANLGAEIPTY